MGQLDSSPLAVIQVTSPLMGHSLIETIHTHTYCQFKLSNSPQMHIFGLWQVGGEHTSRRKTFGRTTFLLRGDSTNRCAHPSIYIQWRFAHIRQALALFFTFHKMTTQNGRFPGFLKRPRGGDSISFMIRALINGQFSRASGKGVMFLRQLRGLIGVQPLKKTQNQTGCFDSPADKRDPTVSNAYCIR